MEHSYSRDCRPVNGANGLKTRTLMIHRSPDCSSCYPNEETQELDETNRPPTPTYNEHNAKESMSECLRISKSVSNENPDNVDWENNVNMTNWTDDQTKLFSKIAKILDADQLARLATEGKQGEAIQKRLIIDRSVKRFRKQFAKLNWDLRLTQWLHEVLINNLPSTYMASYLDILQTLKAKLPQLMDKVLFGKPMNISQDLLAPVLKKKWEILLDKKERKLPGNVAIVIVSSGHAQNNPIPNRIRNWYELFSTMAQVVLVNTPNSVSLSKQPLQHVIESIILATKTKIQELKSDQPNINIVLLGFNAGAAIAVQVAYTESVNCVVCIGFACNTLNGIRGIPDDRILDIVIPIMFVIGQNSGRTSQEEIEALREKMKSETSLLVVGSADDVLRIPKNKKQLENLTQTMVDSMVTDEIHEFIQSCISKPPGPRTPTTLIGTVTGQTDKSHHGKKYSNSSQGSSSTNQNRKRKYSDDILNDDHPAPSKKIYHKTGQVGRPRTRPLNSSPVKTQSHRQSSELNSTEKTVSSVSNLPNSLRSDDVKNKLMDPETPTTFERQQTSPINYSKLSTAPQITTISTAGTGTMLQRSSSQIQSGKLKLVPSNQVVQIKPPIQSQSKIYTIKTAAMSNNANMSQNSTHLIPVSQTSRTNLTSSSSGQLQILPIKNSSTNQFLNNPQNQIILNPQKYTISKTNVNPSEKTDISNIFDMPILFADNDGNLHDSTTKMNNSGNSSTTSASKLVALPSSLVIKPRTTLQQPSTSKDTTNTSQISSGTFVLNPTSLNKPKISGNGGKVVFINRNTMKPYPSIISKPNMSAMKYTKVVVNNPQTSTPSLVQRAGIADSPNIVPTAVFPGATIAVTTKDTQNSTIAPTNIVKQIQPTSGILNCTTTTTTQPSNTTSNKQYQVLLNLGDSTNNAKTQSTLKNVIKVDPSQINQTIFLKTGNTVKQMPLIKTNVGPVAAAINKNLSIKKVNFIPNVSGAGTTSTVGVTERNEDNIISTISLPRTSLVVQPITSSSNIIINKNQKFSFNANDGNVKK